MASCNFPLDGSKQIQIHATGNNANSLRSGIVIVDEVLFSFIGRSNNTVAILDQFLFGVDAKLRFILTDTGCVLNCAQGVEPHHMGDTPPLLQPFSSQTRKPVMAMYQIISKPVLLP